MWCFGILLMVCTPVEGPKAPLSEYCEVAKPVRPSRADTLETQKQAAREFGKWKSLCENKGDVNG